MGAQQFRTTGRGKTIKEAYDKAYYDAVEEYGHQEGYSGEINSTWGFKDLTEEYKNSGKTLSEFMLIEFDKAIKYECYAVCIQSPKSNTNKIKSVVENIPTIGTTKWLLKYTVCTWNSTLKSFATKGDAIRYARDYTEQTEHRTTVVMEKVLEKGSPTVARISYKKSGDEKLGEWVFFGIAPC